MARSNFIERRQASRTDTTDITAQAVLVVYAAKEGNMRLSRALLLMLCLGGGLLAGCSTPPPVIYELPARPPDPPPVVAEPATNPAGGTEEAQADPVPEKPGLQAVPVPSEIPGAETPALEVPPIEKGKEAEREQIIDRLFPPLPPPGETPVPHPAPGTRPLELPELQAQALANSPVVQQAAADVAAARGVMIQAGAYPNPMVGFEGDALGQGAEPFARSTGGQLGGFVNQTIKTKGKLGLARASAEQELRTAEYALRRARFDVLAQVQGGYYAVLSAQENLRVDLAFAHFTEAIYRIPVGQLKAGEVAPYEPLQFRALAVQARVTLAQARHRYLAAWKLLAAAMGLPGLPPSPLGGRLDAPIPVYRYDALAGQVLARHTDILIAQADRERTRSNLRLAQVAPFPDIDVRVLVQKDYTAEPHNVMTSVQVGGPIPVWNRNQGNIMQAEAQLERATEEERRVRIDLSRRLAEAFERYSLNRELLAPYRGTLLPDQVRVLNGVFQRVPVAGPGP